MGHPWASPYGLSSLRHVQMAHVLLRTCPGGVPNRASPASPYGPSLGLAHTGIQPDRLQIKALPSPYQLRSPPIWGMGPGPWAHGLTLGSQLGPHGSRDGPSHTTRARIMRARACARAPAE